MEKEEGQITHVLFQPERCIGILSLIKNLFTVLCRTDDYDIKSERKQLKGTNKNVLVDSLYS